jgi:hypothetical protein
MAVPPITDIEKFLARVEQRDSNQCWWWSGAVDQARGYPKMPLKNGSQRSLARFGWEIVYLRGPIPAGFVITRGEHEWDPCPDPAVCPHRLCMNPAHMRLSPKAELAADRLRAIASRTKTHCRRNHPLTDDNVVWLNRSKNKRMCRICHEALLARYALARP